MAMHDSSPLNSGLASAEQCAGLSEYELQRMWRISRELCTHISAHAQHIAFHVAHASSSQKTA